jgi:4-amino-4-deoxy-L-arabinose transferase-like glycosyltransferase
MLHWLKKEATSFYSIKKSVWVALMALLVLGAFFRFFHLTEWVHFELDQARDARVITDAINQGVGALPLLGPRAGGTFLRLGPAFYYLEYLGALVFGSTPSDLALPIAIFSLVSIVSFFFLLRRYFKEWFAITGALLFSVSSFLVMYGRFAWNPNPLPFFLITGFLALLVAVDTTQAIRRRWKFLIVATMLLGIAMQLHFLAFIAIPIIVGWFLAWKRPKFSFWVWTGVAGMVVFLSVPMLLNEIITHGANTQEFLQAVSGKSNKAQHSLLEQMTRDTTSLASGTLLLLSGYEGSAMGQLVSLGNWDFELVCGDDCHQHFLSALFGMSVLMGGVFLLFWRLWREIEPRKKDFLVLMSLWFVVCFGLFIPLSYDIAPRFFLLIAPFPFVFLLLILDEIQQYFKRCEEPLWQRTGLGFAFIVVFTLTSLNIYWTLHRFGELRDALTKTFDVAPDRILKEKTRVTLEQQYAVVDFMHSFQKANHFPVYMFSEPEYRRALKYLMNQVGITNDVLGFTADIYVEGNSFLVLRTESNHDNRLKKYLTAYSVVKSKQFGTLTVFHLVPKPEFITAKSQIFAQESPALNTLPVPVSSGGVPARYTWSEWWHHHAGTQDDGPEE